MSLIFKKGAITWTNGTFLSAEHLKDERNFLLYQIRNIQHIMHNYTHVESIKFNEIALNRNSLEITHFEGMMNDMQYIEYDSSFPTKILENGEFSGKIYEIKEDLTQYSKLILEKKGLTFHLVIDGDYEIIDSIMDNVNNSTTSVSKSIPKLKLLPEHLLSNKISIPVCKIIKDEYGLNLDSTYIPPTVFIKQEHPIYNKIVDLSKDLRVSLLDKAAEFFTIKKTEDAVTTERYAGLYFSSIMPSVLNLESSINSNAHPKELFAFLQAILGSLSLLRFTHMPSARLYNHNDIYNSLSTIIDDILTINNSMEKDGEKDLFDKDENGQFTQNIPSEVFMEENYTYLIMEMQNEKDRTYLINWIEEARICGDNFLEQIKINRIRGIDRTFKDIAIFGNKMLVVELSIANSKYINLQSKKIICFNNFSGGYEPASISLYWRHRKFND